MRVVVNGEEKELGGRITVAELLTDLQLDKLACAVEVNRRLIPKSRHLEAVLNEGDRVEVVTLVGGG